MATKTPLKNAYLTLKVLFILKAFELYCLQDTHREKSPPNKTPAFRKSTNMGVWAVGTLSQLFIGGYRTETKLKKISSYWQNSVLCDRPFL